MDVTAKTELAAGDRAKSTASFMVPESGKQRDCRLNDIARRNRSSGPSKTTMSGLRWPHSNKHGRSVVDIRFSSTLTGSHTTTQT